MIFSAPGRPRVKFSFNKYLLGQTLNGLGRDPNPVIVAGAVAPTRTWNDANRDFIPQCDLTNLLANGECAQANNLAFGSAVPTEQFDQDLISGFNHRQANWELSVSVVHELMPRVGLDVGYFRRSWANFRVTDNLLVDTGRLHALRHDDAGRSAAGGRQRLDGARLRGRGAGQVRPGENYNTLSTKIGDQTEVWQGVDFTSMRVRRTGSTSMAESVPARPRERLRHPDGAAGDAQPGGVGAANRPALQRALQDRDRQSPYLTQFKLFGAYAIPKVDVQVSGTFRSVPGRPGHQRRELRQRGAGRHQCVPGDELEPGAAAVGERAEIDAADSARRRTSTSTGATSSTSASASCCDWPAIARSSASTSSTRSTRTPSSTSTRRRTWRRPAAGWRPTGGRRRSSTPAR